ncbi:MAG: alpha/beta fold hydrolase [Candidatus Hydrogenedentales bacterium]
MISALLIFFYTGTSLEAPPFYPDKSRLLCVQEKDGSYTAVESIETWQRRREHILENVCLVMGPLPDQARDTAPDYQLLEEIDTPRYKRQSIRYNAEPGPAVTAFLFLPHQQKETRPAMMCLHPTSSLGKRIVAGEGEKPNRNYASELAERGYVVLAPDYPGFGDDVDARKGLYEAGYVSCSMKGIWNHLRGVDLLASLPQVDPQRMGCIGHSLGGHNTLFLGLFDTRLRVLVTSCGFNSFTKYMGGDLTGWSHDGYMPRIADIYGSDAANMPFDFTEVVAALAPRTLFINAPLHDDNFEVSGVRDVIDSATPVYALYGAQDALHIRYPEAEHDFPTKERYEAYAVIDEILSK